MLKKIIAASFVFAFFACSSDGDDNPSSSSVAAGGGSNSSQGEEPSSSSQGPIVDSISIAAFNGKESIFKTWGYGYTLRDSQNEDLTPFWDIGNPDCPIEEQTTHNAECELPKDDAILQNTITNQYSDLHYKVDGVNLGYPNYAIELKEYKLGEGEQAALGLDVGTAPDDISKIEGAKEFIYRYAGGAHEFRAVTGSNDDFWFVNIPASAGDTVVKNIPISGFAGMGSFAADEDAGTQGVPFDLSQVKKFLWVVEYNADVPANNQGSLLVDYLSVKVER
jgi:hypothetical protein